MVLHTYVCRWALWGSPQSYQIVINEINPFENVAAVNLFLLMTLNLSRKLGITGVDPGKMWLFANNASCQKWEVLSQSAKYGRTRQDLAGVKIFYVHVHVLGSMEARGHATLGNFLILTPESDIFHKTWEFSFMIILKKYYC